MTADNITALRLALRSNGYDPLPLIGKKCLLTEWSAQREVSPEGITQWGVRHPGWNNTGILTEKTPAIDGDIMQADAAEAVADTVREWFGERGTILTRFGASPKFATLLRTERPFEKKLIHFVAPDGCKHKIEILGAGQQLAVAGVHPDTKKPYAWHGGYAPFAIARRALPEIDEKEAEEFLNFVADMLAENFGFQRVEAPSHGSNGAAGGRASVELEAELASMCDGASTNAAQTRIIPSLLRKGGHPDDVLKFVVDETMARVGARLSWTREKEIRAVVRRILSSYKNLLLKDYDPATGVIPAWLPGELHAPWIKALEQGRRPAMGYNRGGFYVRSYGPKPQAGDTNPGGPGVGEGSNDGSPAGETPKAKPTGWNYFDSTEIQPQHWLVKQLLPETGVGVVSGQWGSFKTTAALDLSIAVMTGQPFAEQYRVKRQGAVLYFALEGAGTLKLRLNAIAHHRGAPEKLPFAWRGNCPVLTDKSAGPTIVKYVDEAAVHFEHAYGMPVVLIWVDTYITAAGLSSSGDDNDAAATQKAFNTLRFVAAHSGSFVAVVDHLGKVVEAGTRGSSGKEGNADTVLATLAEREITGAVSNSWMAARKQRDGISGFEVPFTPETVELGLDEDGDPITAAGASSSGSGLCKVLADIVAKHGFPFQPDPGGSSVQACHGSRLQAEFFERRLAEGTPKQQYDKRLAAYKRALKATVAAALIGVKQ
jgi:hypothetical protein